MGSVNNYCSCLGWQQSLHSQRRQLFRWSCLEPPLPAWWSSLLSLLPLAQASEPGLEQPSPASCWQHRQCFFSQALANMEMHSEQLPLRSSSGR